MRSKTPFRLFKRIVGGRTIWYYTTYDEYGKRLRYSTGCTNKTSANNFCMELYKQGKLIPDVYKIAVPFSEYAKDWWVWGKCPYLTSKIENGYQIGKTYANTNRMILNKRILPYFADIPLHKITVEMVENWMHLLGKEQKVSGKVLKPLAPKSIRNYVGALGVMLDEAARLELIKNNPCKKIRMIAKRSRARGILTVAEARLIFSDPSKWFNHHAYLASLLASVTGARLSEIRALQCSDVYPDHIHIEHSLDGEHQIKATKTGDVRDIPVPLSILTELEKQKRGRTDGFLLCYPTGKPYGRHVFLDNLKNVMELYSIDWKGRNIGFHSWRHFLNTQLLSHGISGEKTREITGHTTEAMTQRYKHFQLEDYREVLNVTEQLTRS